MSFPGVVIPIPIPIYTGGNSGPMTPTDILILSVAGLVFAIVGLLMLLRFLFPGDSYFFERPSTWFGWAMYILCALIEIVLIYFVIVGITYGLQ